MTAKSPPRAFTLLELLLASMMIAVVVAAAYGMYVASLQASTRGTAELECCQTGRTVLRMLADDLRSAMLTRGVFGFGLVGTDGGTAQFASDRLRLSTAQAVRWRAEPEGFNTDPLPPLADFREVTYYVVSPPEAAEAAEPGVRPSIGLIREVRTNLLSPLAEERSIQLLSRLVVSLQIQYHDGTDWVDNWDAGAADLMPQAVRITVVVVPREEDVLAAVTETPAGETVTEMFPDARTFTTVVYLPTAEVAQSVVSAP